MPIDILSVPVYRIFNNVKDYVAIIDTYDLLSSMEVKHIGGHEGACQNGIQFCVKEQTLGFLLLLTYAADMHGYLFLVVSITKLGAWI